MSMKNSSDTIGNQTCDLPVCSAVPQPLRHHMPHNALVLNINVCVQCIALKVPVVVLHLLLPFKLLSASIWSFNSGTKG
jgi:hypothetical protein